MVTENILDLIGNTPLLSLKKNDRMRNLCESRIFKSGRKY